MHEPPSTAYGSAHLIAKMVSRIAPVGLDPDIFKEGMRDITLGRSSQRTVKRSKHEPPPPATRIRRIELTPEIAIRDEIGQPAQKKQPTLKDLRGCYRIGKKSNPTENAVSTRYKLNAARGAREKDMLNAIRSFDNRNAALELGKVELGCMVAGLPWLSQEMQHEGGQAGLPEDIGIEGGAGWIFERIRGRM